MSNIVKTMIIKETPYDIYMVNQDLVESVFWVCVGAMLCSELPDQGVYKTLKQAVKVLNAIKDKPIQKEFEVWGA